jgi:uncharacterized phage infection (PIP) family protein YhgE
MAEEIVLSLKIDGADKAITSIDQLEREVAQLEETMRTADFGSQAFKDAEKELKAANAELYKFDRQLEAIQDPVKAQEKWVKYGEGVAGAFAAAQGAAAIFGVESENVEKMVVKAQGAVSIAMGARMLAESQLLTVISSSSIAQKALSVATAAYTAVVGGTTGALKLLRVALVSTGIGAIAVAIGILVANWNNWKDGIKNAFDQIKKFVPQLQLMEVIVNKAIQAFQWFKGKVKDATGAINESKDATEEATKSVDDYRAAYEAHSKAALENKRAEEEAAAARRKAHAERMGQVEDMLAADALLDEILMKWEGREAASEAATILPIGVSSIEVESNRENLGQIVADRESATEAVSANYEKMREQRKQDMLSTVATTNATLSSAQGVANGLSALSDAFAKDGKKNAKLQKTLAVAQIAIDTAKGIAGAVAAGAGVPFPGNIPAIVSGVTAVLTNIAAAKKALSQAGEGGDEGGGTPGVPTISAPTFSAPTATGGGEAGGAEAAETAFQTAGRAYVLDSDVSSGLEAQQRINDLASL